MMGLRLLFRARTCKRKKCSSSIVHPIGESSPFSSFELFRVKPSKRVTLPSSSQVLVPETRCCQYSSNLSPTPSSLSFPWIQLLSRNEQLSFSRTLLTNLTILLTTDRYSALLHALSCGGGNYSRALWPYVQFALGYSYYKLGHFKYARQYISECKLNATRDEDIAYCFLYLGKIANSLQSHRKAAKHFRKALVHFMRASMNFGELSLAETFDLEPISLFSLHLSCSSSFRQANRFSNALHNCIKALQCAATDDERMKAHFECGKLYQLMVNHTAALEQYCEAITCRYARLLGNSVAIQQAYKDCCGTCIALEKFDSALNFFEKALLCFRHPTDKIVVPSIDNIRWICEMVTLLPIRRATKLIPYTYVVALFAHPELASRQFLAELERHWYLHLHPLPTNYAIATDNNTEPVVCEEDGQSDSLTKDFAPSQTGVLFEQSGIAPFTAQVEVPPPLCLFEANADSTSQDTHSSSEFQAFLNFYDPYL